MTMGFCCCEKFCSNYTRPAVLWNDGRDPLWKQWHEADLSIFYDPAHPGVPIFTAVTTGMGGTYPGYSVFESVSVVGTDLVCIRDRGDGLYARYTYSDRTANSTGCGMTTWNYFIKDIYITKGSWVAHYRYHDNKIYVQSDNNVGPNSFSCPPSGNLFESVLFTPTGTMPTSYTFNIVRAADYVCKPNPAYVPGSPPIPCCGTTAGTLWSGPRTTAALSVNSRDGYAISIVNFGGGGELTLSVMNGVLTTIYPASTFTAGVCSPPARTTFANCQLNPPSPGPLCYGSITPNTYVSASFCDWGNTHDGIDVTGSAITIAVNAPAMGEAAVGVNPPCLTMRNYSGVLSTLGCDFTFAGTGGYVSGTGYNIGYRSCGYAVAIS